MQAPLVLLALPTLGLGLAEHPLERFLGWSGGGHPGAPPWLAPLATGLALAGVLLAWLEFGRRGAPRIGFVERMPALARLFAERWYLDHLYRWLLERLLTGGLARLCSGADRHLIDGAIDRTGRLLDWSGRLLTAAHGAMVGHRLLAAFLWTAAMGLVLLYAAGGK
jgi:NADH-quinone oxidoreductase subunit L